MKLFFRALAVSGLVALASVTTTGCFSSQTAVAVASSTVPLEPDEYEIIHHPVSAESNFTTLFGGIPIQGYGDQMKRARDQAITSAHADALINVSVIYKYTNYWGGIVIVQKTTVTGDAVRIKSKNDKK